MLNVEWIQMIKFTLNQIVSRDISICLTSALCGTYLSLKNVNLNWENK